ncbi:MAG: hypothetical protein JNL58_28190 [Planctomyces sp.]|nr:hypothetical protein [Planctomyces sp.]
MASVSFDPASNQFHIRFRFAGQAFKRSLKTASQKDATAALARVEETLSLLQRGVLELPAEADPAMFLLAGGKTKQRPQKVEKALTLGQLIDSYLKSLPEQAKEKTTLKTEATHIKHFRARLPMSKAVEHHYLPFVALSKGLSQSMIRDAMVSSTLCDGQCRMYKEGDQWKDSSTFGRDDLPLVSKLLDQAHSWIFQHGNSASASGNGEGPF